MNRGGIIGWDSGEVKKKCVGVTPEFRLMMMTSNDKTATIHPMRLPDIYTRPEYAHPALNPCHGFPAFLTTVMSRNEPGKYYG